MKRFFLYLARWQLSGIVLAPVLYLLTGIDPTESVSATIIANLIGGTIFYWVDKRIFRKP